MWGFLPESIKLSQKLNFKNSPLLSEIEKKKRIHCLALFQDVLEILLLLQLVKLCDTFLSCNAIKCNESLTFRGVWDF